MKYYRVVAANSYWKYKDGLTIEEFDNEPDRMLGLLNYNMPEWRADQCSGYVMAYCLEEDIEKMSTLVKLDMIEFIEHAITKADNEIEKQYNRLKKLYSNPLYKSIYRDNQINSIIE